MRGAVIGIGVLLAVSSPARAQPTALRVTVEGDCPSAANVEAALARVLPMSLIGDGATATVRDRGNVYSIDILGVHREIADAARACDERARAAAVAIALVLDPPKIEPSVEEPPPDAQPPVPPLSSTLPVDDRPSNYPIAIELGALLVVAPGEPAATGGARLAVAAGYGGFAAVLSTSVSAPIAIAAAPTVVDLTRIPLGGSLRVDLLSSAHGRVDLSCELGIEAALLFASARGLATNATQTRAEISVSTSATVHVWLTPRAGLLLAAHVVLDPRPYELDIEPVGQVATTPWLWLGLSLGVAVRAR